MTKRAGRSDKRRSPLNKELTLPAIVAIAVSATIGAVIVRLVDAIPLRNILFATAAGVLLLTVFLFVRRQPRRRLVLGALVIGAALLGAILVRYPEEKNHKPNTESTAKTVILVANFVGPDPSKYIVTETILGNLRVALQHYPDIEVVALGRSITEQDANAARTEGQNRSAAFVIWGRYAPTRTHVGLAVHFTIIKRPPILPELSILAQGQLQTAPIQHLEDFTLQLKLSQQMAYLSLFVAGIARYDVEDWPTAEKYFTDAMQHAAGVSKSDQSLVQFYLGNTRWF